jgi:hypothetical protein
METFLQVVGSLALGIIIIIVGLYLYIRIKLGKYANVDSSKDMTPLLIHLNEEIMPKWISKKNAQNIEKELINLGFIPDKAYNVVEIDGMQLRAFFNTPYTAIMYTHPIAGLWVDMVASIEDGKEYTVTNAPMGGEMDTPPNTEKHFLKDLTVSKLYSKLQEVVGSQPVKALDSISFRDYFENAYKREMQWKNKNGGVSFEEFMRVVENDPKKYNEKEIIEAFTETKRKELLKWHDGALEEYKIKENIPENDCYDIFEYLFIIPSKTDTIGFIRYLGDVYYITDEQAKKFEQKYSETKNLDIRTLFKEINESFSTELRAVKKSNIDYPIDIEIYKMPKRKY